MLFHPTQNPINSDIAIPSDHSRHSHVIPEGLQAAAPAAAAAALAPAPLAPAPLGRPAIASAKPVEVAEVAGFGKPVAFLKQQDQQRCGDLNSKD